MLEIFPPQHTSRSRPVIIHTYVYCVPGHGKLHIFTILSLVVPDSDEDFLSLKNSSKPKENGCSKVKKDSDSTETKSKQVKTPPVKSPSTKGDTKKDVLSPTPPKSAAPKHTPTSVLDYFGNAVAKRSNKKLVASTCTKRKAVSTSTELQCPAFRPCSELVLTVAW